MEKTWPTLALIGFLAVTAVTRAELVAEPASVDLGRQLQGKMVSAKVRVVNQGSAPVQIDRVTADCSCTAATAGRPTLAPGESTEVEITTETRWYQGDLKRRVMVQTAEGDLVIPVKVRVVAYENWEVTPYPPIFPPSARGAESSLQLDFGYSGQSPATITRVQSDQPWLAAEVFSDAPAKKVVRLTKKGNAPAGNHQVRLEITTSDAVNPTLKADVFVPVTSRLEVDPNPIILPAVKVGAETSMLVNLLGWDAKAPLRLELAQGRAEIVHQEGARAQLKVTAQPTKPGVSTQLLRIYSGQELEAEIPIVQRAEP